jgi:hypothetical protein
MGTKITTISGLVIPTDWNEDGTILAAAIFDHEEKQYVIQQDEIGEELLGLIHEEVEVEGTVMKGSKGQMLFRVKNFWLRTEHNSRGVGSN